MFTKLLIANRGEIACRIMRTARRLGIATVAVYSDADRHAQHVRLADEAVRIGPAPSRNSYLNIEAILQACRQTGAQAVHPGYGFLSENAAFAQALEDAGIVFVGPRADAIRAMGDKIASRLVAQKAGVNTIPGHDAVIDSAEEAVEIARGIGYPVMIKASAGGGGKGLRVAYDDAQALSGFQSCRSEAMRSFGDDRIFIEKYIEQPRHIEIQVLADAHGNAVYLWERECSLQRRHQKLIEEAPSAFLSEPTRKAMGEQAVALAHAVDYLTAGTVEFVVGKDQSFYFLEMNTRLQVEHPVTEAITGLDLVEWMLRAAAGEPLTFGQEDIPRNGWAIECRINAEDPYHDNLPSTGRVTLFQPPEGMDGVRVDSGVTHGSDIPVHYDPMMAKLIVHAPDRKQAIARMAEAIDRFVIRGVESSLPLQAELIRHPAFAACDFDTGFLQAHYPSGLRADAQFDGMSDALAALVAAKHCLDGSLHAARDEEIRLAVYSVADPKTCRLLALKRENPDTDDARIRFTVRTKAGTQIRIAIARGQVAGLLCAEADGKPLAAQIVQLPGAKGYEYRLQQAGLRLDLGVLSQASHQALLYMPAPESKDGGLRISVPMAGVLLSIAVKEGDEIHAGDVVGVVEAMKMEHAITAQADGRVTEVNFQPGQRAGSGDVLLRLSALS